MEENYTPRQRNRRSERYIDAPQEDISQPLAMQQPLAVPQTAYQQTAVPQPVYPPQNAPQQSPYARPVVQQPAFPQTPVPQTPVPQTPVPQTAYPPQPIPQRPQVQSRQQVQRPVQSPNVQYVARGTQPVRAAYPAPAESPTARQGSGLKREQARSERPAREPEQAREPEEETSGRLPAWLNWGMSLMVIVVMALIAAYALMQAYLTTQANEREAARQAVLSNYHVTEQADGTMSVTWQEAIERYATQYNLQPAFVTAIIRNESSFRTNAESGVGARGLMQMMPDTAEWIAGKLGDDHYHFDMMWDAETNIRYGCWYLGYLSDLFAGDPILTASAYHAGQGEVRSWLGDRSISPDGRTVPLDNIPIGETKTYAGRVTQAYGIYQALLYPASVPADGSVPGVSGNR